MAPSRIWLFASDAETKIYYKKETHTLHQQASKFAMAFSAFYDPFRTTTTPPPLREPRTNIDFLPELHSDSRRPPTPPYSTQNTIQSLRHALVGYRCRSERPPTPSQSVSPSKMKRNPTHYRPAIASTIKAMKPPSFGVAEIRGREGQPKVHLTCLKPDNQPRRGSRCGGTCRWGAIADI